MSKININLPKSVLTPRLAIRPTFAREGSLVTDLLGRNNCDLLTSFYGFPESYITSDMKELERINGLVACQTLKSYGIFRKGDSQKLIGQILLDTDRLKSPRIGFYIANESRRQGYAEEAHRHMIKAVAASNPKIKTIWEEVVVGNNASRNLLIKNGFKVTGVRQSSSFGLDDKSLCLRRALN